MAGRARAVDRGRGDHQPESGDDEPPRVHPATQSSAGRQGAGTLLHRGTRRATQGPGLQPLGGGDEQVVVHGGPRRRNRTLGPDDDARRGDQLGHIGGQQQVRCGDLAEPEVDHPHPAVVGAEQVGQAQVAVGDAVPTQEAHLLPDLTEHLVGDLLGGDAVERTAGHGVVGQHERVRVGLGHRPHPRRAHPEVAGHQGDERLVLDRSAQRRERPLVAAISPTQGAVHPEQQVGAALVGAERLDEVAAAVGGRAEVRRRPTCVHLRRVEGGERQPDDVETVADRRRRRAPRRRAEHHEGHRAGEPTGQRGVEGVERDRRRDEADPHQTEDGQPAQPPPPASQPGRCGGECRGECTEADDRRGARGRQRPEVDRDGDDRLPLGAAG